MDSDQTSAGQIPPPNLGTPELAPIGYVATVIWAAHAFFLSVIGGLIYAVFLLGLDWFQELSRRIPQDSTAIYNGVLIANIYFSASIIQTAILCFAITRNRWRISDYLALVLPKRSVIVPCLAIVLVLVVLTDGVTLLLGYNPIPDFQIVSYRTAKAAGWLPLLAAVIIVLAPIAEEILFRGFLYRGFTRQPSHAPYAVVITSILFAVAHQQYNLFGIAQVFAMGLLFGWVRWKSGSTMLTIMMHVFANLIAMIETAIYMEWWLT